MKMYQFWNNNVVSFSEFVISILTLLAAIAGSILLLNILSVI